ncbi:MAG: RNA-binding cell elongation regulator Jag/EloR [Anaerolineales bacterium]
MNNKQTTLEIIAPTVEDAVEKGLGELMMTREEVDVEVLDEGSRGLFGLGTRQVRIRISVKDQDSIKGEMEPAAMVSKSEESDQQDEDQATWMGDEFLDQTEQVVSELLHKMKVTAQVSAHYGEEDEDGRQPVYVDIRGNDLGILIGRKAEILNAFQYIVNLIMGKRMEQWVQIIVDVEGYRSRREEQIRQMAVRMAAQAVRTGRRQVLEPMTPAERRLVHLELRSHPEVTTQSIGEDPTRKVTISPKL